MLFQEILSNIIENIHYLENKRIFVWGTGKAGKIAGFILKNYEFNIKDFYYIDNAAEKWGQTLYGREIYAPLQLQKEDPNGIVILLASTFWTEISSQLSLYGFVSQKNYFPILSIKEQSNEPEVVEISLLSTPRKAFEEMELFPNISDTLFFEDMMFLFTCNNRNRGLLRMNFDEAACMWKAVKKTKGNILEIGRRHGGSTILLLAASDSSRSVYSVDIAPQHGEEAESFFCKYQDRINLIIGDSRIYQSPIIGLLFIDGDHSFEGAAADTMTHWSSLQPSADSPALVIFHDAFPNNGLEYVNRENHCPGVKKVCELLLEHGVAELVATVGSLVVLRKIKELPKGIFN